MSDFTPEYTLPHGYRLFRRNGNKEYSLFYHKRLVKRWEKHNPVELEALKEIEEFENQNWGHSYTPPTK